MLQIHLLGDFRLLADERPLHLQLSPKEQALLVYLAWLGKPQPRTALGQLFWEGRVAKQARSNLRTLLARSRELLGDYLTITRDVIAFDERQEHWLDAHEFLRHLSMADHLARQQSPGATAVGGRLMRALALYQDGFLAGFELPGNERFMAWVEGERAVLRGRAIHGWRRLARFHEERGDFQAALESCRQLLGLDPFDEDAHAQILQLYRRLGQIAEALDHYERYCRQLHAELGLSPGDSLLAAFHELRHGHTVAPSLRAPALPPEANGEAPHDNLPAPVTPLVGRRRELAELTGRFLNSPARLVSVVGPGGIGKTHLALQAANRLRGTFLDGIVFVALPEEAESAPISRELPANALAHALDLRLHGRRSTREQLLDHLRPREMLLLLDNVETALAESRTLIQELLHGAPDVRLLITSREPLGIPAEELLVLDELPVPEAGELALSAFEEERYASLQLFVERARRTFAGFTLNEENIGDIARICRLVGGIPLAIELAAAWVGHFNSAEIAEAIERNLSFLQSPLHREPARHQSITNVFDYSWELLVSHERRVLVQLALFRGSFSRDAAQAVAGAPLPILMSLVNKSMLRLTQSGRYELHELVRRFARMKWPDVIGLDALAEAEQREPQLRYGRYYLGFIAAEADGLHGPAPEKTIRAIQAELGNISRAWEMMLALEEYDLIVQSANGLSRFYHYTGQYRGAAELFAAAAEQLHVRLGTGEAGPAARVALARVQSKQAFYLIRLGQFEQAGRVAQLAAATAEEVGDAYGQAESFLQWGEAIEMQGPLDIPRQKYTAALEIARAIGDDVPDAARLEGRSLALLGRLAWRSGEIALADSYYRQALALERARGDLLAEGHLLTALGANAGLRGELDEAEGYFGQAQALYRRISNRHREAGIQQHLGRLRFASGRYEEAAALFQRAARRFRDSGDHCSEGDGLRALGEVRLRLGRPDEARRLAGQALAMAQAANDRRHASAALRLLGNVERFRGRFVEAGQRFQEALTISQAVGDQAATALLQGALGLNHWSLGQYDLAWHYCHAALQSATGLVDQVAFLADLALVALALGDTAAALDLGQQGLLPARRVGLPALEARLSMRVGDAHARRSEPALATAHYRRAISLFESTGERVMAQEPRAALAMLYLEQGEAQEACRHAEKVLTYLRENELAGCYEPFRVYLSFAQVLRAAGDARANRVLGQAYERLQLQAAQIEDAALRRLFLERVPAHRAIVAALAG